MLTGQNGALHLYKDMHVLTLSPVNPAWMWFGYPSGSDSRRAFLLSKKDGTTDIYDADKWMHACVTYDKTSENLTYVLVCYFTV